MTPEVESPRPATPSGLLVVGVGRSGTSIATRLAVSLGLTPPQRADLMPATEANPTGHWESESLTLLNATLLRRWGRNWWLPPPAVTAAMLDHIEEFAGLATAVFRVAFPRAPWAWKDPRLTVLLPFWERVLGTQPVLFPHRDPGGVARSICRRDGLSPDLGLAIWERHARLALAAMAGRSVAVASYSRLCADPEGWRSEMASFCADVGLSVQVPSDSARAYVLDVPAPTSDEIPLSAAQASLYDIVRSLEGTHLEFPRIDAPREDASVGRRIAAISRRTRTRRRRPRGLLHHRW